MDRIIIFYDTEINKILSIIKENQTQIDIENYRKVLSEVNNINIESVSYIFEDEENYNRIMNNGGKLVFDIKDKKLRIRSKENIDNSMYIYSNRIYKRDYTKEEIISMYEEDYLNTNIKNIANYSEDIIRFIKLEDLKIRASITGKRWDFFSTNKFLLDCSYDKLPLGQDIMEKGTYYPLIVCKQNNDLYVMEGNHRAISLKLNQKEGLLSKDYKILCVVLDKDQMSNENSNIKLDREIILRFNLDALYSDETLNDPKLLRIAKEEIINAGGRFINDYTYEKSINNYGGLLTSLYVYPLWVRDLIYPFKDEILPSKIINDERKFEQWRRI